MAENRNRTARKFSRRENAPTAVAPADNVSFVLPPRSSATHRESPRSLALSSTLVPASSLVALPPPLVPLSPPPPPPAPSRFPPPTPLAPHLVPPQPPLL